MAAEASRRRVVIIGGGFGGLAAARGLRRADVDVTVVDPTNHCTFQPLLYQVATGAISLGECASPIRGELKRQRNVTVLMTAATAIDPESRSVSLDDGETLRYDSLIVACGARTSYFGNDQWASVSFGLKTVADALALREQVFGTLERAERATDADERARLMTFVIVGGGPTGVETAGQLQVLTHHQIKRDYRRIDPADARVILVDAGDRIVPAFSERLSAKAAKELASLGVEVRHGAKATTIDADGVEVEIDGQPQRIEARTVVWAAGVRAASLAGVVAEATGAEADRGGRVLVNPDLSVADHPEISMLGDAVSLAGEDGKPLPGLATTAIQQGRHVAAGIASGAPGATSPFKYFDKGALAVVGRGRAVCEFRGRGFAGPLAFLIYLTVHLYYLGGVAGRRFRTLSSWATAGAGALEGMVIVGPLTEDDPAVRS